MQERMLQEHNAGNVKTYSKSIGVSKLVSRTAEFRIEFFQTQAEIHECYQLATSR